MSERRFAALQCCGSHKLNDDGSLKFRQLMLPLQNLFQPGGGVITQFQQVFCAGRLHCCNMPGHNLITFECHWIIRPIPLAHEFYMSNYITTSLYCDPRHFPINISNIIRGECLAKITTQDGSQMRGVALAYPGFLSAALSQRWWGYVLKEKLILIDKKWTSYLLYKQVLVFWSWKFIFLLF